MKIRINDTWYDVTKVDIDNHCYWYAVKDRAYSVSAFDAILETN